MTVFRCVPVETEIADRFRRIGLDDNGNTVRQVKASHAGGFPCRHCLLCATPGETMLLGSYNLLRPLGIYWTPSPIFLHAEACARFASDGEVAPIIRLRLLLGFGVMVGPSRHQACNKGAEQGLAASACVVHEPEEAEIERQLVLRDAPMRAKPGAQ